MDRIVPVLEGEESLDACAAAVARAPRATALFCDIDGTIAPIASRPGDASVPGRFRDVLGRLIERLGLVVFATGRTVSEGRRMVGLDGAIYIGTHGFETIDAAGDVHTHPEAERYVDAVQEVAVDARAQLEDSVDGITLENKRTVLAVHYRLAADPDAARHEIITRVIEPARDRGLAVATGHFVFEVRPPVPVTKGTEAVHLLEQDDFVTAVFCGDDLTDVTGFDAIHQWARQDARRCACAVAAVTDETPQPVVDEADVLVPATAGVHGVLRRLLAAAGG